MNPEIQKLRNEVEAKERAFSETKKRLDDIVKSCQHKFGETIPDPIVTPGYFFPGDPPGTCGVDRRPSMYVQERIKPRWKRICDYCGKVEYTEKTREEIKKFPVWPEDRNHSRNNYFPEERRYS